MQTPALIFKREFGTGDIQFTPAGFAKQHWLISAVFILLFTYARADEQEVLPVDGMDQGGYWGDVFFDKSCGSLLWLLQRESVTAQVLSQAEAYARDALQPLIDESRVKDVSVTGNMLPNSNRINLNILITLNNGDTLPISTQEHFAYALAA